MTTIAIVSGGMDSVTLAYHLRAEDKGEELILLSFDYGQRHSRELQFATLAASRLGAAWTSIEVPALGDLGGSALTDSGLEVPEGHYADENMRITVVPNRNMVMLSLAVAAAVAHKARRVATGVHAGDHAIYPDCRPQFIEAVTNTARIANEGFIDPDFEVYAPFVKMSKADIASVGDVLGVPWRETWSCYKGGDKHCGKCGTCVERREAFELANVSDPTDYE